MSHGGNRFLLESVFGLIYSGVKSLSVGISSQSTSLPHFLRTKKEIKYPL